MSLRFRPFMFASLAILGVGLAVSQLPGSSLRTEDEPPTAPSRRTSSTTSTDLAPSLDAWRSLYADRPMISQAETELLELQRLAAADALVARVGAGGAAIVPSVLAAIRAAEGSRERLVLVEGLGRNSSAEAVDALLAVYAEADTFRLQEEVLRALGRSEAAGATEALVAELSGAEDERLRQLAAGALAGEAEALDALYAVVVDTTAPINARLEAIPSIGAVGDEEAKATLQAIASDEALEPRVRRFADHELARTSS